MSAGGRHRRPAAPGIGGSGTTEETTMTDDALETLRRRIDRLERRLNDGGPGDDSPDDGAGGASGRPSERRGGRVTRRSLLQAIGVAGLVGYGASAASADPQGQLGTASSPLRRLYLETLAGGLTGGEALSGLDGPGLRIEDETLRAVVSGIENAGDGVPLVEDARRAGGRPLRQGRQRH